MNLLLRVTMVLQIVTHPHVFALRILLPRAVEHFAQEPAVADVVTIINVIKMKIGIILPTLKPGKYSQAFPNAPSAEKLRRQAR